MVLIRVQILISMEITVPRDARLNLVIDRAESVKDGEFIVYNQASLSLRCEYAVDTIRVENMEI